MKAKKNRNSATLAFFLLHLFYYFNIPIVLTFVMLSKPFHYKSEKMSYYLTKKKNFTQLSDKNIFSNFNILQIFNDTIVQFPNGSDIGNNSKFRNNSLNIKDSTQGINKNSKRLNKLIKNLTDDLRIPLLDAAKKKRNAFARETLAQPRYQKMSEHLAQLRENSINAPEKIAPYPLAAVAKSVHDMEVFDRSQDKNMERNVLTIQNINSDISDLLIGGDMLLSNDQIDLHFSYNKNGNLLTRQKRQMQIALQQKWSPRLPISYYFDQSIIIGFDQNVSNFFLPILDKNTRRLIRLAAAFWSSVTCISFQENARTSPKIRFFKGQGCYSNVGKAFLFGHQDVSIGAGCELFGTITHEMGHVLGFFHHQSRTDRDKFITVMLADISPIWRAQYDKEYYTDNLDVNYDYGSIMHYSGYKPRTEKIEMASNDKKYQHTMGNNYGPLFSDILAVNKYYNCQARCPKGIICKNFGFRNSRDCKKCICPNGFGGNDCSQRAAGEGGAPKNCGETVQAEYNWKEINGSVETKTLPYGHSTSDRSAGCHFHIVAPVKSKIELEMISISGTCSPDCYFGAIDIKIDDITKGGIRMCCNSHIIEIANLTSNSNLIVMSLYTQKSKRNFSARYRIFVEESMKTTTTVKTTTEIINSKNASFIKKPKKNIFNRRVNS